MEDLYLFSILNLKLYYFSGGMNMPHFSLIKIFSSKHNLSLLQALFVTFLWSTSFIIIKWGLAEIPPVTYAGLRYMFAFICFFPFIYRPKYINEIKQLDKSDWKKLIALGFIFYTFTQGAQFLGLSLLPSVTVSLMLNFTPLIVAVLGYFMLKEKPSALQLTGAVIFITGIIIYFSPSSLLEKNGLGIAVMIVGVFANSFSSILGRDINRRKNISPIVVTFISMGIGAIILVIIGFILNGIPAISTKSIIYLIWLASINTALAFTLWNHTLRNLTAMESSIINGTMLIQIAVLAYFFLGEDITFQKGLGMLIAAAGTILVQIRKKNRS